MFGTGMLAAALSLFAFQVLQHRIPETVEELGRRKVLIVPDESARDGRLREVTENLAYWMNHRLQYLSGVIFALLVFLWFPLRYLWAVLIVFGLLVELVVAFFVGLLAWRMLVTGAFVWGLGRQHRIRPQLDHPVHCGGPRAMGQSRLWYSSGLR